MICSNLENYKVEDTQRYVSTQFMAFGYVANQNVGLFWDSLGSGLKATVDIVLLYHQDKAMSIEDIESKSKCG